MKFLHLFHEEVEFGNIAGYEDIKDLVRHALDSDENYNLLLCGPPANAKTTYLEYRDAKIIKKFTDVFSQDTIEVLKFTWHVFSFHNSIL